LAMPGAELPREQSASGVLMIPVPNSGTLQKVEGEEEARSTFGIVGLEITARLQDYITAWPEGSSYLGFLFARGERPDQVEGAIRAAHARLLFTLVPRLPVEHPVTGKLNLS
jgi:L-amino acid ligase C-terminal domain 2